MSAELNSEVVSKVLAQAIDHTSELILVVDASAHISLANNAFYSLSEYMEDEVVGKRPYDFIVLPEDTQFLREGLRALQAEGRWQGQLSLRKKSGLKIEIYLDVVKCQDEVDQSIYYICLGHDLIREQDLQHQMEEVQRLETVGSLANGIAHHFNNILASIAGQMELLMTLEKNSSAVSERGKKILDASKRGQEVVEQLMTFCRKTKPEQKRIDIAPVIRHASKMVEQFYVSGIEIETTIPEKAPAVLGTAEDINQIVVNLLTNAVEAIDAHGEGGRIHVRLSEAGKSLGLGADGKPLDPVRCLKLSISDTGVGMDETVCKQLFDPFFTTKNRSESSGMGLTVTHSLVKRQRGKISVISAPNEGTTFEVYFPVLPNESIVLPEASLEMTGSGEKVFYFDTDEYVKESGGLFLKRAGYDVHIPDSIDSLGADGRFDLAILGVKDVSSEDKAWVRSFKSNHPGVPLLVTYPLSKGLSEEAACELFDAHACVAKPCESKQLVSRIQDLLKQKKT